MTEQQILVRLRELRMKWASQLSHPQYQGDDELHATLRDIQRRKIDDLSEVIAKIREDEP